MRPATEVFSEWAKLGKDSGMEDGHAPAVNEILAATFDEINSEGFSAIDAGCGNGWVVRMLSSMENCESIIGVDGADAMIARANKIDSSGKYICADLQSWSPTEPVDLVHSMEVLYYLDDIPAFLESVRTDWLQIGGILAFGIDHYQENEECHGWSEKVGVDMAMFSESEWREMVEEVGFEILRTFRANQSEEWAGTLAIIARNSG
tara:strand:- start:153 stop:770 length:618 start_codon:yes stop_codon:yes gene_type:complete